MTDPSTKNYDPPPFLQRLGLPTPVRTPLGHYRTESLFLERWRPIETMRPAYTLEREQREDPRVPGSYLPSFQKRYVELMDPSGYQAAMDLLGSWTHWQKLRKCPWFREHMDVWNEEIVAALRAKGLGTFVKMADKGDLKAAEWLTQYTAEGPPVKSGRGRPSKAQIAQAARQAAESNQNLSEDAKRLGLNA